MPDQTIFIDVSVDGDLRNAYRVVLGSSDLSYGIKETETDSVVVPYGAEPLNPSVGRYEYTFDADNLKKYSASWEVQLNANSVKTYKLQGIGPFLLNPLEINAVTDFRGTFLQDSTNNSFMLQITNFNGEPLDVEEITYEILDPDLDSVVSGSPERVRKGYYVFDWDIDEDQDIGKHKLIWKYTVDGIVHREVHDIIVSENVDSADDSFFYSGVILSYRQSLGMHLECAMSQPLYFEQAQPSRDRKTFRFTKQRWNQTMGTKVYRNKEIVNSGFEIDYRRGLVIFESPLTEFDVVHADYNFRWFSDEQLDRYLSNALHAVNLFPPESSYDLASLPQKFVPIIMYGAAKDALRQLMLCLQYPEPAELFGGPDRANQAFQNMETLKRNYNDDWLKLLEQKKFGAYPRGVNIVSPEFTLPGGRSRWFRYLFGTG